ncbi:C1 family peptidase [Coprobacter sp.]
MNRKIFFLLMGVSAVVDVFAQTAGGIDDVIMQKIKAAYKNTATDKAVRNALNADNIQKLAANACQPDIVDGYFSNRVFSHGVTDQKASGRCWLFTGLNVFRAKVIDKYKLPEFEFSQNYNFFYDQLEKANLFLQGVIDTRRKPMSDRMVEWLFKNPLSDGGQFTGVLDIIGKYGVVPKEVMNETFASNNTSQMAFLLKLKLREFGLQLRDLPGNISSDDLEMKKTEMLGVIYRMLVLNLGEPPVQFTWTRRDMKGNPVETKQYTPKSFYNEYVGKDLTNGYVMLMNDPAREYYKLYEIDYDRHMYDGYNWKYINLPVEDIKSMAIASIKDSTAMYFSCDVAKFLNRDKGTLDLNNYDYESLMGTTFGMDKKQRVQSFASGSSHAMTLVAVDLDDSGKPVKWLLENSWGATNGYKGHLIMTDRWFDEYMFRLVVEKKYVPKNILNILNQNPICLPAWDPMFAPEQ